MRNDPGRPVSEPGASSLDSPVVREASRRTPPEIRRRILDRVRELREREEALSAISNLAGPTTAFIGRAAYLEGIQEAFEGGGRPVLALWGLPGVGKSQLARIYADRHRADYDAVWWVPAERPATILASLAELAGRLGLPDEGRRDRVVARLRAELGRRGRWLLVFDGAEGEQPVARHLPPGGRGHVLITSRSPAFRRIATTVRIEPLQADEAASFLLRRTGSDDAEAAAALAEELGRLPLALEQAVAYVEQAGASLAEYLELFRRHPGELLDRGGETEPRVSVGTTFGSAYLRIVEAAPAAAQLATLCSFMAPAALPDGVLSARPDLLPRPLRDAVASEPAYRETLAILHGQSLVEPADPDDDGVRLHRLLQAVILHRMPAAEREAWAERAVRLLAAAWPDATHDPVTWPACRRLLSHARVAAGIADRLGAGGEATARLLRAVGAYHLEQAEPATAVGEPSLALAELERAMALFEAARGPGDAEVTRTAVQLSRALRRLGRAGQALGLLESAVRAYEGEGGKARAELAAALTYLGATLRDLGQHDRALAVLRRALAVHTAVHGHDSGEVAWTLTHLGGSLRRVGDHAEARRVLERALGIVEARSGADHHRVAEVCTSLGRVLRRMGDYDGSRAALERARTIAEAVFGHSHHRTAEPLVHIGALLRDQGHLPEAREVLERALAIHEAVYGANHFVTARTRTHLGRVLRRMDDLDRARRAMERALRATEGTRGPDHRQVAWTLVHLSTVLQAQGDVPAAKAALEEALGIVQRAFGRDHADVAWSLTHLAAAIVQEERDYPPAARAALEEALGITERAYGPGHLDVAWTLTHVGVALQRAGQFDQARPLLERALRVNEDTVVAYDQKQIEVLAVPTLTALGLTLAALGDTERADERLRQGYEIACRGLGPDHPYTREVWHALRDTRRGPASGDGAVPAAAEFLTSLGDVHDDVEEAEAKRGRLERVLAIKKAIHGPDHPQVADVLAQLGVVAGALGDPERARARLERALTLFERAYGPSHPKVADTLTSLGAVLRGTGELPEALDVLERARDILEAAFGPEHRSVALTLDRLGLVLGQLGRMHEARDRLRGALSILEREHGADHPTAALTAVNLGIVQCRLGEVGEARERLGAALNVLERTYGPDHPQVANALIGLGYALLDLGEAHAYQRSRRGLDFLRGKPALHPEASPTRPAPRRGRPG